MSMEYLINGTAINGVSSFISNASFLSSAFYEPVSNMLFHYFTGAALAATVSSRALSLRQANVESPGYVASNVQTTGTGLTADLALAGPATNSYGMDIENLKLSVNYDTGELCWDGMRD